MYKVFDSHMTIIYHGDDLYEANRKFVQEVASLVHSSVKIETRKNIRLLINDEVVSIYSKLS